MSAGKSCKSLKVSAGQKLIPYTMSGHESLSELPDPLISETLTAESRAKVKAILTEYDLKRAAIMAEGEEDARAI